MRLAVILLAPILFWVLATGLEAARRRPDAFEMPLAFLMAPQNHKREAAQWNTLPTRVYAISCDGRKIWGVTAGILRNLWERIYSG